MNSSIVVCQSLIFLYSHLQHDLYQARETILDTYFSVSVKDLGEGL